MAINFPTGITGQYYTYNGRIWQYNGYAWVFLSVVGATGATGPTGATGSGSGGTGSGVTGSDGSNSGRWISVNTTSGGNPGSGNFYHNSSTLSGTTAFSVSNLDPNGVNYSNWHLAAQAIVNSGANLYLQVTEVGKNSVIGVYQVSTVGSAALYHQYSISSYLAANGSFTDGKQYTLSWSASGNQGPAGPTGATGSGGGSSFTYAQTLFVDPNGDDGTAIVGRLDFPWGTIQGAINACEEGAFDGYTIWVFPGDYREVAPWEFRFSSNITVKLNGGVNILFALKSSNPFLIKGRNSFSIVGDDRSNSGGLPNAQIICKSTDFTPETLFELAGVGKSWRISNVAMSGDYMVGFNIRGSGDSTLHVVNTSLYSPRNNIRVFGESLVPRVAVTNSIFITGSVDDIRQYANIIVNDNYATYPGTDYFNGIWNFENVRFVNYYNKDFAPSEEAHIFTENLNRRKGMYVTLSNCKFYSNNLEGLSIWYENGNVDGDNTLEIVGTSIGNSSMLYDSGGSTLTILGNPTYINTPYPIIDPAILEL